MEVDLQKNSFSVLHNENEEIRRQRKEEKKFEKATKRLEEQQAHHAKLLENISEGQWNRRTISNWADLSDDDDFFYDAAEKPNISENQEEQLENSNVSLDTISESDSDEFFEEPEESSEIAQGNAVVATQLSETSTKKKKEKFAGKIADFKRKQKQNIKQQEWEFLQSMMTESGAETFTDKTKEIDTIVTSKSIRENPDETTPVASNSATAKSKKKKKKGVDKITLSNVEEITKQPSVDASLSKVNRDEALRRLAAKAAHKKKEQPMDEIKKALVEEAKKKKGQKKEKKDKLLFPKRQSN